MGRLEHRKKTESQILEEATKLKSLLKEILDSDEFVAKKCEQMGLGMMNGILNATIGFIKNGILNYEGLKGCDVEMQKAYIELSNNFKEYIFIEVANPNFKKEIEDWYKVFSNFIFEAQISAVLQSDKKASQQKDFSEIFSDTAKIFQQHYSQYARFFYKEPNDISPETAQTLSDTLTEKLHLFLEKFKREDGQTNILIDYNREFKIFNQSVRNIFYDFDEDGKKNILKPDFVLTEVESFMSSLANFAAKLIEKSKHIKPH